MSPENACTMNPVIVCMGSRGLAVNCGLEPAASATIIVSPTARDIARMNDATTPEMAAGTTICQETSSFVPPKAYAPSRSDRGTARIASSLNEATSGIVMMPTAIPAASALKGPISTNIGFSTCGRMNVTAKNP